MRSITPSHPSPSHAHLSMAKITLSLSYMRINYPSLTPRTGLSSVLIQFPIAIVRRGIYGPTDLSDQLLHSLTLFLSDRSNGLSIGEMALIHPHSPLTFLSHTHVTRRPSNSRTVHPRSSTIQHTFTPQSLTHFWHYLHHLAHEHTLHTDQHRGRDQRGPGFSLALRFGSIRFLG